MSHSLLEILLFIGKSLECVVLVFSGVQNTVHVSCSWSTRWCHFQPVLRSPSNTVSKTFFVCVDEKPAKISCKSCGFVYFQNSISCNKSFTCSATTYTHPSSATNTPAHEHAYHHPQRNSWSPIAYALFAYYRLAPGDPGLSFLIVLSIIIPIELSCSF